MLKKLLFLSLCLCLCSNSIAQVNFSKDDTESRKNITASGFIDYPPFGSVLTTRDSMNYKNIFSEMLEDYAKDYNFNVSYRYRDKYRKILQSLRAGDIDIMLGVYSGTDDYRGLELIYPAIISNPIVIVTLPKNSAKIKNIDDLGNLKGAIGSFEYLSDYVKSEVKKRNVLFVETPFDLYKKLYTGDVDYILASAYNARIVIAKLGLTGKFSISQNAVWDIPIFLGISKFSPYRDQLRRGLTKISENPDSKVALENLIKKEISQNESLYSGVVAPDFFEKQ